MAKIKYEIIKLFTKFDMALFTDNKELNKFLKMHNQDNLVVEGHYNYLGRSLSFFNNGIPYYVMFIDVERYIIGTAIHESTHIIDFLMMDIGINDIEFRAYMIEELSINIINYMNKVK